MIISKEILKFLIEDNHLKKGFIKIYNHKDLKIE